MKNFQIIQNYTRAIPQFLESQSKSFIQCLFFLSCIFTLSCQAQDGEQKQGAMDEVYSSSSENQGTSSHPDTLLNTEDYLIIKEKSPTIKVVNEDELEQYPRFMILDR